LPNKTCKELPVAFKNLQTLLTGNRGFLYPASSGLVAILTWGISITLVIQCNTQPAGIHTVIQESAHWTVHMHHHNNTIINQLDGAHVPLQ
jgi:hypothetical protein